jgi:hypothetical protein
MTNGGRAMHIRGRVVFVCNTSQVSEPWEKSRHRESSLDRTDQQPFDFLFRRSTLVHSSIHDKPNSNKHPTLLTQISFAA